MVIDIELKIILFYHYFDGLETSVEYIYLFKQSNLINGRNKYL